MTDKKPESRPEFVTVVPIRIDGNHFEAGEKLPASIPDGTIQSMRRMKQIATVEELHAAEKAKAEADKKPAEAKKAEVDKKPAGK